ncbi:MAG: histidine phosphatase family protein [Lachnospiraceae bacterium]|nr:histidine phosphatase family protein [Lachnospiraceae bacterium]
MEIMLYLIRHGKTPGNEEKRYIGRTQESLSKKGREELLEKRELWGECEFLFSSPMTRCLESCECIWPRKEISVIPEFEEIDFGAFEGKNYQELSGDPDYQAWIDSGGTMAFPKGESREAFQKRCVAGFERMVGEIQKKGNGKGCVSVAAVVHGGTIMSVLSALYGGDYYDYQIPNASGYFLKVQIQGEKLCITQVTKVS